MEMYEAGRIATTEARHARAREMAQIMSVEHLSLEQVGQRYGITRERVRQLLVEIGFHERNFNRWENKIRVEDYVVVCHICGGQYLPSKELYRRLGAKVNEFRKKSGYLSSREHARAMGHPDQSRYTAADWERDKAIAADYRDGAQNAEILRKYGLKRNVPMIYNAIRRVGVPRKNMNLGRRAYITEQDKDQIVKLHQEGWYPSDLGRRFDVTGGRIVQILRARNAFIPRAGRPPTGERWHQIHDHHMKKAQSAHVE